MKILIVGSLRFEGTSKKEKDKYHVDKKYIGKNMQRLEDTCTALGRELVLRGHMILTGVADWPMLTAHNTVATFLTKGAISAAKEPGAAKKMIFYQPEDPEPEYTNQADIDNSLRGLKSKRGDFEIEDKLNGSGESKARTIPNIKDVDAVMLISGHDGTASIGYAAHAMGIPVIALATFKGAAQEMYENLLRNEYLDFEGRNDFTVNDLHALDDTSGGVSSTGPAQANPPSDPYVGLAKSIVDTTEKLVKAYNQPEKHTLSVLRWMIAILFILLLAWVGVYLGAANSKSVTATPTPTPTPQASPGAPLSDSLYGAQTPQPLIGIVDLQPTAVPTPGNGGTNSTPHLPAMADFNIMQWAIVILLVALVAWVIYYLSSKQPTNQKWILLVILGLLCVWVVIYLFISRSFTQPTPEGLWVQVSFFGLLYISALLGAGLRIVVSYQNNQVIRLTYRALAIDLVISLIVAFGMALIYLIGGISFTGTVVVLPSDSGETFKSFTTVAVTMSVLGLAAGYLVPLNKLTERLENLISPSNQ